MALKLITAASTYPVTLAEAKLHCRVDDNTDDALITALIASATEMAEQATGRAIMAQTWELSLDAFEDEIILTRTPVASITSIKYIDTSGVEQTLDGATYTLDATSDYGYHKVTAAYGLTWPATRAQPGAVKVRYVANYTVVPEPIKSWIKLMVSTMYENRETEAYSSRAVSTTVQMGFVDRLLDRYKVIAV